MHWLKIKIYIKINIMKKLLLLTLMMITFSCNPTPVDRTFADKIVNLEHKIQELEAKMLDQQERTRILHMIKHPDSKRHQTSLEDGLLVNQFWDTPFDENTSACSRSCSKEYQEKKKACDALPDGDKKIACIKQLSHRTQTCHLNCIQRFLDKIANEVVKPN